MRGWMVHSQQHMVLSCLCSSFLADPATSSLTLYIPVLQSRGAGRSRLRIKTGPSSGRLAPSFLAGSVGTSSMFPSHPVSPPQGAFSLLPIADKQRVAGDSRVSAGHKAEHQITVYTKRQSQIRRFSIIFCLFIP